MRLLFALLYASILQATPTNIVDVLLQPSGNPQVAVAGMDLTIQQTAFVSGNNFYPGFTLSPHPVSDSAGNVNLWLEPNVVGQPYQVLFRATNGVITRECWNVPTSGTALRIKDVRSTLCAPIPSLVVQPSQIAQAGALQGYLITWNDTLKRWEADVPSGGIPAGNSGGIPYYNTSTTIASSPTWPIDTLLVGGGAGASPQLTTITYVHNSGGSLSVSGNLTSVNGSINANNGSVGGDTVSATTYMVVGVSTVAALPNCAFAEGQFMGATDLLTPSFLANAVGGGAVHGPVYCNGTRWITY